MSRLDPQAIDAVAPVLRALERLNVPHYVGGSMASSAWGIARSTVDVDVIADLRLEQVTAFCDMLGDAYYADPQSVVEAIRKQQCFNVILLRTMHKVDVFPVIRPIDREALRRVRTEQVMEDDPSSVLPLASPEDTVLNKLVWYRAGGEVSDRQWIDLVNVLRIQARSLDQAYLGRWAAELGVSDLLRRARDEAAMP